MAQHVHVDMATRIEFHNDLTPDTTRVIMIHVLRECGLRCVVQVYRFLSVSFDL